MKIRKAAQNSLNLGLNLMRNFSFSSALKFLLLLPFLALGAQALEPKIVMQPEPVLKNGLYFVADKPYSGTLKVLHYSAEDLYDVNFMGVVYPRAKPLPPTLIREIDVKDGTAVLQRDYFDGRDKPSNEYPLKNGLYDGERDGAVREYYRGGALQGEYEFERGKQTGTSKQYYASGALAAKVMFRDGRKHGLYETYHENGALKARVTFKDGLETGAAKHYYADGKLEAEGEFERGRLVRAKKYDEAGNLISDKSDKNGLARE